VSGRERERVSEWERGMEGEREWEEMGGRVRDGGRERERDLGRRTRRYIVIGKEGERKR
jgi:hypothetical protein